MNENTDWWEWDAKAKRFSFQKTEDHIFAPYNEGGKRIGDMNRDELIKVIAVGYYEREQLAKSLVEVCDSEGMKADHLDHARSIVARPGAEVN